MIKGSCRSGGSASVAALMEKASTAFLDFGGHAASGGFSVAASEIHLLEDRLGAAFEGLAHEPTASTETVYDGALRIDDVNWDVYKAIDMLAPFGTGNEKPLFVFPRVQICEVKSFGKEKNHTEIILKNSAGRNVSAISFFKKPGDWKGLMEGATLDLVAHMEKSTFKNYPELRLKIIDII